MAVEIHQGAVERQGCRYLEVGRGLGVEQQPLCVGPPVREL